MYVRVEAKPGAKKESVIQTDEKTYAIAVREPAERNLANLRIREVLARHLGVGVARVKMVSGHRSPRKIFDIET